jgi:hypothetical protein
MGGADCSLAFAFAPLLGRAATVSCASCSRSSKANLVWPRRTIPQTLQLDFLSRPVAFCNLGIGFLYGVRPPPPLCATAPRPICLSWNPVSRRMPPLQTTKFMGELVPISLFPLQVCQGNCDNNDSYTKSLVCFTVTLTLLPLQAPRSTVNYGVKFSAVDAQNESCLDCNGKKTT